MALSDDHETNGASTNPANRRNGKAASCEPCRKRKIRCDHGQPICGRCKQRGLEKRCYYHPAPLTRLRESLDISSEPMESAMAEVLPHSTSPSGAQHSSISDTPGSHTSSNYRPTSAYEMASNTDTHTFRLQTIEALLSRLHWIDQMKKSIEDYYAVTASAVIPGGLILPAIRNLHERWAESKVASGHQCKTIARRIMKETETPIDVSQLTWPEFCKAHQWRLETLGILFAIAGRSTLYYAGKGRSKFVQEMFQCSNDALRLAREMIPIANDALVWLHWENYLFTNSLKDDPGSLSWRRLAALTNELFQLGMHRESSYSTIPFFLAELRRRVFVVAFHSDKLLATLDDRPPGISRRYCDARMPLDLADGDMLVTDPADILRAQHKLTSDGWSIEEQYSSSTWCRLRFGVGVLREEVLEYTLQPPTAESVQTLRNLVAQNRARCDSFPPHLRYSPERWDSGLADTLCYMLTATYLSIRQLDFQVYQLLEKSDPEAWTSLLEVSNEIVNTVLHVGNLRTRASFLAHDFKFLILSYGLPCAATLAAALERTVSSTPATLPSTLSRSALIRNLSVFVTMLESLEQLPEVKKSRSMESARLISRAIDKALDGPAIPTPGNGTNGSNGPGAPVGSGGPAIADQPSSFSGFEAAGIPGGSGQDMTFSNFDPTLLSTDGVELLDFASWANSMDWSNMGNDWMTF